MTVIEAPIIHEIRMRYCRCAKSDNADNLEQLMRNAWYPATVTDPGTCATFRCLETYRMYNVVGNLNVQDFITALERVTDSSASSGLTWLPVSVAYVINERRTELESLVGSIPTIPENGQAVGRFEETQTCWTRSRSRGCREDQTGAVCGELLGVSS